MLTADLLQMWERLDSARLLMGALLLTSLCLLTYLIGVVRRRRHLSQLITDYWSPDPPTRERAILGLKRQGPVAVRPLLHSLQFTGELTAERLEELPQLLAELGPRAIPVLLRSLDDRDDFARLVAVAALGRLQALNALGRLTELVEDPSSIVRNALANALATLTESGPQSLARQWLLRRSTGRARFWLYRMGRFLRLPESKHPVEIIVQALRRLLTDSAPAVRCHAVQALGQLGPAASAAELELTDLLCDPDESVRCQAVIAVACVISESDAVNTALLPLLGCSSSEMRIAAARAAGLRGEDAAPLGPALLMLLQDADAAVREAAAAAIPRLGTLDDEACAELAATLAGAYGALVRTETGTPGTVKIAAPETLPALIEALDDADDQVRLNAARALAGVNDEEVFLAVAGLLNDPHRDVRLTAAQHVLAADPNHPAARAALVVDLESPDPHVREAARAVVRALRLDRPASLQAAELELAGVTVSP